MRYSSTPNTSEQQFPQSPISRAVPPYSVPPLFQRISWPPGQDQENGKRTYCWLPTKSFWINLKDTSSHISIDWLGLHLSPALYLVFSEIYKARRGYGNFSNLCCLDYLESAFTNQKI